MSDTRTDAAAVEAISAYREFGTTLEALSRDFYAANKPLHARHRARFAFIAFRAERAEMLNPDDRERSDCACVECLLFREYAAKGPHPLS